MSSYFKYPNFKEICLLFAKTLCIVRAQEHKDPSQQVRYEANIFFGSMPVDLPSQLLANCQGNSGRGSAQAPQFWGGAGLEQGSGGLLPQVRFKCTSADCQADLRDRVGTICWSASLPLLLLCTTETPYSKNKGLPSRNILAKRP